MTVRTGRTVQEPEALAPPSRLGLLGEARVLIEPARWLFRFPSLLGQPRGNGEPVLVLPGYGASDGSTRPLRGYLRFLGYRVHGWSLGRNDGAVGRLMGKVATRLAEVAEQEEDRVRLIGWSLGGYLAREAARDRPDLVARVITMGSPVVGGPKYTAVAGVYARRGIDLDAVEAEVLRRYETELAVPVTAIYTRSDGVVAWRACIDHRSPRVEHLEVHTTHLGLGFNPEVYRIIAQRLASR